MTRSNRRRLALAIALAAGLAPATAAAQPRWDFSRSGTVFTRSLCGAVTPVVLEMAVSVPTAGSGNTCSNDLQCTGAGEACVFESASTSGSCRASGLLVRDDIHYVAGGLVDVDVTVPDCSGVSDVWMGGRSLSTGGFDAASAPASWWRVSTVGTTVNGQNASRQRIRIQFPNFGDGQSTSIQFQVTSTMGGATLLSAPITLAKVAAVNAAIRSTVAETRIRNEFVTSMYRKFGDTGAVWEDGERVAYGLDWSPLTPIALPSGIHYRGTDMRLGAGVVAFSTQFKADEPGCDPNVYADGWSTLVPDGDSVRLEWIVGPRVEVDASGACAVLSLGVWDLVTDAIADEEELALPFAKTIATGFAADENGRIKICDFCRVVDVQIGAGKLEIWTKPPVDAVRLNVSTTRLTDVTADPSQGLVLPAGLFAPIAAGGSYESCQSADGRSPASCPQKFVLDMDGLFNWRGSDVPVPSPIVYNEYGVAAIVSGRLSAWFRLQGLVRDPNLLPEKSFPAGALLARRTPGGPLFPTSRARVSNGCVLPPDPFGPYRVSLGVNDIATPVTGDPPTRGKLDATVLIAANAAQSVAMFGSKAACKAVPIPNPLFGNVLSSGTFATLR